MSRIGLIINPVAGLGGTVGLKGSDGIEIQRKAISLGAIPQAASRAEKALKSLRSRLDEIQIVSAAGEMGEDVARKAGFTPLVVGEIRPGETTPEDTAQAARLMLALEVTLLLFAGGDGTARDIFRAIGDQLPVIGIPAGVKIHSAVFATHPHSSGELAAAYLQNRRMNLREAEVVDLDEDAYREGIIATRLFGYMKVPYQRSLLQNKKAPSPASEAVQAIEIARDVIEGMKSDEVYILGPGTTIRAIADGLGLEKTLVGVDVLRGGKLIALDVNEEQLVGLIGRNKTKIFVTPIGGQGFIFGRGNQPISAKVIMQAGTENIQVICTLGKLHSLYGQPFLVDTGSEALDKRLSGYVSVTTGFRERVIYRVAS